MIPRIIAAQGPRPNPWSNCSEPLKPELPTLGFRVQGFKGLGFLGLAFLGFRVV